MDRVFHQFFETPKKFEKKSRGAKISKKCHEKVNALQAKQFLIFKTRVINQSGNYLKPLELDFSKKPIVKSYRANEQLMSVEQQTTVNVHHWGSGCSARLEQIQHIPSYFISDLEIFLKKQAREVLDNYLIG